MNYQLAKKLKDAGFPQKREYTYHGFTLNGEEVKQGLIEEIIPFPTLSELIEACGEEFKQLERKLIGQEKTVEWFAIRIFDREELRKIGYTDDHTPGSYIFSGSTPEEAVVNLWLEINKK